MTPQIPDNLIYEGQEYGLFSNPLEDYFDEDNPRPEFLRGCSALWRGYIATWEIEDGILYLIGLEDAFVREHDQADFKRAGVSDLFPWASGRVKATWFTGELRVPQGERLEYVHMGYAQTYEEDLLLTFEEGKLVRREVRDNRHLIPEIRKRKDEAQRKFEGAAPYVMACFEGRKLRWKEMPTADKVSYIIAVPIFIIFLPVLIPYMIYKHGWNPKNWNLF